jgi:hypothetical protein
MPRREDLYLADILTACRHVSTFLDGKALDDWIDDELLQFGVLQRLTVIGEAARRLDPAVRNRYPGGAVAGSHRIPQPGGPRLLCRGVAAHLDDRAGGRSQAGRAVSGDPRS